MAQIVQRTLVRGERAGSGRGTEPSAAPGVQSDLFEGPEEKLPKLFIATSQSLSLD